MVIGTLLGFVSAERTVEGRGTVVAGTAWRIWPSGTDPYVLAHYLGAGMLPPDSPQWTVYETQWDSTGAKLDSDCVYAVKGKLPAGRWWRMSAEGKNAAVSPPHRSWLQSDNAVLEADGTVRIALSPSPRPANWLMPPDVSDLRLLLFVLEENRGDKVPPPAVDRISCP
jgi:hypothetical protein